MPRSIFVPSIASRILSLIFVIGLTSLVTQSTGFLNLLQPTVRAATTFTVNSTGDGADRNTSDGVCDDGSEHCTLRAAIQQANANTGTDTINFNVGSGFQQITLTNDSLPNISDPIVINATTQPGYSGVPLVELVASRVGG